MMTPDESLTQYSVNYLRKIAPSVLEGKVNFFLGLGYHRPHLPWVCSQEYMDLYPMDEMDLPDLDNKYYPTNYPQNVFWQHKELLKNPDVLNKTHVKFNEILDDDKTKFYRRAYFGCVSFVDDMVGIVVDELAKLGLADSTVVLFMGDHGWHLGENGIWGKVTTFEQSTHTPLMIHVPGKTDQGLRSDSLVEFIDIFPTVVEAAGLTPLSPCPEQSRDISLCSEGKSFLPLLEQPKAQIKTEAISQVWPHHINHTMGYTVRTDLYRYTEWVPLKMTKIGDNTYNYRLEWDDVLDAELYDHGDDPEENYNLAYNVTYQNIRMLHNEKLRKSVPSEINNVHVRLF
jgi:iduronate 2-sulfatase